MCNSNYRFLTEEACNKDCRSAQVTETSTLVTVSEEKFTTPVPTTSHSDGDESSFRGDDEDSTTPSFVTENGDVQQIKGSCVISLSTFLIETNLLDLIKYLPYGKNRELILNG